MAGTSGNIKHENEGFELQIYGQNSAIVEPLPTFPYVTTPPRLSFVPPPSGFPFVPSPPSFSYLSQSERLPTLHTFPLGGLSHSERLPTLTSFLPREMNIVKQEENVEGLIPLMPSHELGNSTRGTSIKMEDSSDAVQGEPTPPGVDFIDDPGQHVAKKAGFFILTKDYFLKVMKTDKWKSLRCTENTGEALELPFTERMEGWIEERRPRLSNGRIDKFYYHQKSDKTFRTFLAMLRFVKYGILPKRP